MHRDIKPPNVIFVNGVPRLADIGLVANIDATMSFVGTAGYVPPEGPRKPTGDIYSLGKLLYEISVGRDAAAFPELPTAWKSFADQAGQLEFNAVVVKVCDDRSECLISVEYTGGLRMDPAWQDLQAEPRFQQILKRTGLDKWPRDLAPGFVQKLRNRDRMNRIDRMGMMFLSRTSCESCSSRQNLGSIRSRAPGTGR